MRILLVSIGTRGDMEPFLAVGELLQKAGHDTVCSFPEQFRSLAEEAGHDYESLGTEFMEMLNSEVGKRAMGGSASTWQKLKAYRQLQKDYAKINGLLMQRQYNAVQKIKPDRVVFSAKAIYPTVWGMQHPGKAILVSPVPYVLHPSKHFSHIVFNRNLGPFLNRLSYKLAHWGLTRSILKNSKELPELGTLNKKKVKEALFANRAIYTLSPSLVERPKSWLEDVQLMGYHERNKTHNWKPSIELKDFLSRHEKLLLVTFGSMGNPHPKEKTAMILNVLERLQIPALVNTAGGGLIEPLNYDRQLYLFVDRIPYDYVFPKMYAVVHHGGSGTTHMALKYRCATLVIPHIIDQFLWNKIVARKGAGPKGIAITKLSEKKLLPLVKGLWENPHYKQNALNISQAMAQEDFADELVELITK